MEKKSHHINAFFALLISRHNIALESWHEERAAARHASTQQRVDPALLHAGESAYASAGHCARPLRQAYQVTIHLLRLCQSLELPLGMLRCTATRCSRHLHANAYARSRRCGHLVLQRKR